jgi:hypothetical protein
MRYYNEIIRRTAQDIIHGDYVNSSIVKLLAVVLAWPIVALAIIQVYQWYQEATYVRVVEPLSQERVQHPIYFQFAQEALDSYGKLPKGDRQILKDQLRKVIVPVDVWMERLNRSNIGTVCLGESHDDHNRRFLTENFFPSYDLDTLFVETTPQGLAQIHDYMKAGEIYAPLLGADMGHLLDAVMARNPTVKIQGIEESEQQREDRLERRKGSREDSIYENLKLLYNANERNVVLYGALHCTFDPDKLYQRMREGLGGGTVTYQSILVQGAHQDGLMETFVYFLDDIGIIPGDFVITDAQALPPWVRENFQWLWAQTLANYQSVVVYKP